LLIPASYNLIETTGTKPSQRWGATATPISNGRIVLYGGEGEDEATLSDLHVYDVTKKEWSCPLNCDSVPRTWHNSVYLESKNLLLVFGGERVIGNSAETLSDLMVLDTGFVFLLASYWFLIILTLTYMQSVSYGTHQLLAGCHQQLGTIHYMSIFACSINIKCLLYVIGVAIQQLC